MTPAPTTAIAVVFTLVGGVGLFLLGMSLMTEGLSALGGPGLRGLLRKLTGNPLQAFAGGATITVLMQASSATVLATMGFVAAGMISLTGAVGLVVGGTVGTSSTSWLVSVLGLSSVSFYIAMSALAFGAFLRMFGKGRGRLAATAIAGLALLLASITFIGAGLRQSAAHWDLAMVTPETWRGVLQLSGAGVGMAVLMQSSAAPIALSMVAVTEGSLTLDQACLVLVGATVGTTSTAIIVAIAGGVPARRVALLWTGASLAQAVVAIALLPWFKAAATAVAAWVHGGIHSAPVSLAAFHTMFTLAGSVPLIAASGGIARAARRLVPTPPGWETGFELDPNVLAIPGAAVAAARKGVVDAGMQVTAAAKACLEGRPREDVRAMLDDCQARTEALRLAMGDIAVPEGDRKTLAAQVHSFAALDHLARMVGDMRLVSTAPMPAEEWLALHEYRHRALESVCLLAEWLADTRKPAPVRELRGISRDLLDRRHRARRSAVERAAERRLAPEAAVAELEVLRQVERMAHHAEKVAEYLGARKETAAPVNEAAAEDRALNA